MISKKRMIVAVKRQELKEMLSLTEDVEVQQISVTETGDLRILVAGYGLLDGRLGDTEEGDIPPTLSFRWLKCRLGKFTQSRRGNDDNQT